jgi:hypothetical protein
LSGAGDLSVILALLLLTSTAFGGWPSAFDTETALSPWDKDATVADPLAGPYYLRWDMSDVNGNGDNNAGWTTGDALTAPGGAKNIQPSPLSTATQDLTLGLERGTPEFITPCSATGLACLRFASGEAAKTTTEASTAAWSTFFVDLQPKTCFVARLNTSSDGRLYQLFTTRTNTTNNGAYLVYDDRAASPSRLQALLQTTSPTATAFATAANNSSPTGFAVSAVRYDDVADTLDVFEDGTEVATVSTTTLNPQATAQLAYLGIGTPYITGATMVGDLYEMICWSAALTDEDILAKTEALAAKWNP